MLYTVCEFDKSSVNYNLDILGQLKKKGMCGWLVKFKKRWIEKTPIHRYLHHYFIKNRFNQELNCTKEAGEEIRIC